MKLKIKKLFLYSLAISIMLPQAVHAYAGPGVAIASIIIFFTVIFSFFASSFISLFKFLKRIFTKKKYNKKKNSAFKNKK